MTEFLIGFGLGAAIGIVGIVAFMRKHYDNHTRRGELVRWMLFR